VSTIPSTTPPTTSLQRSLLRAADESGRVADPPSDSGRPMGLDLNNPEIRAYADRLIQRAATRLIEITGLTESDRDDVEQDMRLDLLRRLPRYDPGRSSPDRHLAALVSHKACSILAARFAGRRDARLTRRLRTPRVDDDGPASTACDLVSDRRRPDYNDASAERAVQDLRLDVRRVIASLPERDRQICDLVAQINVAQAAARLGMPRTTLYEELERIRAQLEEAGLGIYREKPPTLRGAAQ
jgi:RNA polymerase sigma-70 factor (ECF subfamily)